MSENNERRLIDVDGDCVLESTGKTAVGADRCRPGAVPRGRCHAGSRVPGHVFRHPRGHTRMPFNSHSRRLWQIRQPLRLKLR